MCTEDNKALARRGYNALNERNWAALKELVIPDVVLHNASMTIQGFEAYKQYISMHFTAFPDLRFTIEEMVAEGDTVVVRQTACGTHRGELMGIPPTGKHVSTMGINIIRFANGKGVEEWFLGDALGLLQQFGVFGQRGK